MITEADIAANLDATDALIHWLVADDDRLNDERFLSKLGELRSEHKKTLGVIESLYREKRMQEEYYYPHHHKNRKPKKSNALEILNQGSAEEKALRDAYLQMIGKQKMKGVVDVDSAAEVDSDFYELDSLDSYYPEEEERFEVVRSARSLLFAEETYELSSTCETTSSTNKIQTLGAGWEPGVTIPQPFKMTIRDETAPIRATYAERFVRKLVEKRSALDRAAEDPGSRSFKATTPPATTYLPLYDELVQKQAERREFVRQYCGQMAKDKARPFKLSSSPIGSHGRRCTSMENLNTQHSAFRASPLPSRILDNEETNEKLRERERKRKEMRERRAMDLLASSALPRNMQDHVDLQRMLHERRHGSRCLVSHSFSPQIHEVPNFKALQLQFEKSLNAAKLQYNKTTVAKPFSLRTENIYPCRHHESHEVKKKHVTIRRSRSLTNVARPETKMTTAAALRAEAIRRHLQDSRERSVARMHGQREIALQEFREKVYEKNKQQDMLQAEQERQRLKALREADLSRQSDFVVQLNEIEERLTRRPSVLDRQELLVRKQSAEARIRFALRSAGFSEAYQEQRVAQELAQMDESVPLDVAVVVEDSPRASSTVSELSTESASSAGAPEGKETPESRKSSASSVKSTTSGVQSPSTASSSSSSSAAASKGNGSQASNKSASASSIKQELNGNNVIKEKIVTTDVTTTEFSSVTINVTETRPKREKDFFD